MPLERWNQPYSVVTSVTHYLWCGIIPQKNGDLKMKKNWEKIKVEGVVEENEGEIRDDDEEEEEEEQGRI